jgi:hypothetical protein
MGGLAREAGGYVREKSGLARESGSYVREMSGLARLQINRLNLILDDEFSLIRWFREQYNQMKGSS